MRTSEHHRAAAEKLIGQARLVFLDLCDELDELQQFYNRAVDLICAHVDSALTARGQTEHQPAPQASAGRCAECHGSGENLRGEKNSCPGCGGTGITPPSEKPDGGVEVKCEPLAADARGGGKDHELRAACVIRPGVCTACGKWLCEHVDDEIETLRKKLHTTETHLLNYWIGQPGKETVELARTIFENREKGVSK